MTREKTLITDEQSLVGATYASGHAIPTYDDGLGRLFICRDSMSILGIARAQTWEDAYSICEDEFFPAATETIEELQREYGFKREHRKVVSDPSVTTAIAPLGAGERFAVYPDDYPDGKLAPTFIRWQTVETPDPDSWSENELFCESFGFRPNGPNKKDVVKHGIYAKDLNGDYLDELTPDLLEELEITLQIKDND